jgi:hypothetical protein
MSNETWKETFEEQKVTSSVGTCSTWHGRRATPRRLAPQLH